MTNWWAATPCSQPPQLGAERMSSEDHIRKALQTIADLPIVYPYELTEFVKKILEENGND